MTDESEREAFQVIDELSSESYLVSAHNQTPLCVGRRIMLLLSRVGVLVISAVVMYTICF